jgi:hypothetical protein
MAVNDTLFFFGDSKVAIEDPRSYHNILCSDLGLEDRYWGSFGRTMQRLSTNYPSFNSVENLIANNATATLDLPSDGLYYPNDHVKAYFTCFGTNDIIQTADPTNTITNFKVKYRAYLNKLLALGWSRSKLNIINCDIIDFSKQPGSDLRLSAYNQVILDIANEFNIKHYDVCTNQKLQNNMMEILSDDGLHLSLFGNQLNAAFIRREMEDVIPLEPFISIKGYQFINTP